MLRVAFTGQRDPKAFVEALRRNPELRTDEYAFVKAHATLIKDAGIFDQRSVKLTYSGDLVDGVTLMGATAATLVMSNTQVENGRMFTDVEDERHMSVVFLGADLKDRFFATVDPAGKVVQIDGRPFEVVGVAKAKGSVFGQSQDNYIAIPDQTYFKMYGAQKGISYNFEAPSIAIICRKPRMKCEC